MNKLLVFVVIDDHGEIPVVFEFIEDAITYVNQAAGRGKVYHIKKREVQ